MVLNIVTIGLPYEDPLSPAAFPDFNSVRSEASFSVQDEGSSSEVVSLL